MYQLLIYFINNQKVYLRIRFHITNYISNSFPGLRFFLKTMDGRSDHMNVHWERGCSYLRYILLPRSISS